jgi:thioredoxin 2
MALNNPKERTCKACGKTNRIPAKHLADTGWCGACKAPLAPVSEPITVDPAFFSEIVQNATVPIVTDFWAAWCGPCRTLAPELDALAREMAGKALVLKIDTEAHPELAAKYRVQAIPNLVFFFQGEVFAQQPGVVPRAQIRQRLESAPRH